MASAKDMASIHFPGRIKSHGVQSIWSILRTQFKIADPVLQLTFPTLSRIIRAFLVEEAKIVKQVMKAASAKK